MAKWKRKILVRLVSTTNKSPLLKISDDRIFMINYPALMTDLKLKELKYMGTKLDIKKKKICCGTILSAEVDIFNRKISIKTASTEYEFEILERMEESKRYYRKFSCISGSLPERSKQDIENEQKLFEEVEGKMPFAAISSDDPYPGAKYSNGAISTSKTSKRHRNRHYSKHKSNTETK